MIERLSIEDPNISLFGTDIKKNMQYIKQSNQMIFSMMELSYAMKYKIMSQNISNLFEEIIVEEGGIESGFKKIEDENWDKRLLLIY